MKNIELDSLTVHYGKQKIIDQMNLKIEAGEFIVIVGPSGSGKSTLLDVIAGLHQQSSGELKINNEIINNLKPSERNMAMVFQDYALYPNMNVYENIEFALKIQKLNKQIRKERINNALDIVKMSKYSKYKINELSGGQKQRVAIARAIATNPDIFLMDEPMSNLDAKLRVGLRQEIKQIHQQLNTTTIMVTHDQTDALSMADRIIVLNQGKIMQIAKPKTIYQKPANIFVARFFNPEFLNEFTSEEYNQLTNSKVSAEIICVKPSDISEDAKGYKGQIHTAISFGDYQILELMVKRKKIYMKIFNDKNYQVGAEITIKINKYIKF